MLCDLIRRYWISAGISFTFETVMSSPDKIELLRYARNAGYRTYLYFIATEDPAINISRVENRVKLGGHGVPSDKIRSRYFASLRLLKEAIQESDRAYIFDNTTEGEAHTWVAEIEDGRSLTYKTDLKPAWVSTFLT